MFYFSLKFSGQRPIKKIKLNIVKINKNEAIEGIRAGLFSLRDRIDGRGELWNSYQEIINEKNELTNFIQCRRCKRIDEYESLKGTKNLSQHAKACSALGNCSLDSFVEKKNIEITKDEKTSLTGVVAEFCYRDMRPFAVVSGAGFIQLLATISCLTAKYGKFSAENLKKILPCANTVIFQ